MQAEDYTLTFKLMLGGIERYINALTEQICCELASILRREDGNLELDGWWMIPPQHASVILDSLAPLVTQRYSEAKDFSEPLIVLEDRHRVNVPSRFRPVAAEVFRRNAHDLLRLLKAWEVQSGNGAFDEFNMTASSVSSIRGISLQRALQSETAMREVHRRIWEPQTFLSFMASLQRWMRRRVDQAVEDHVDEGLGHNQENWRAFRVRRRLQEAVIAATAQELDQTWPNHGLDQERIRAHCSIDAS